MKISVDGVDLYELSDIQKQVIRNEISDDIFDADMKRRLHWVLDHEHTRAMVQLKKEWDSKLADNGVEMIPTDEQEYAQLVLSQPNYKNKKQRDAA
jgi:hypothetical protein